MVNWSRVKDDFQQAPDKGKANSVKAKQMVQNWFSFGKPLVNYSKTKHKSQRTSSKFKQDWDRSQQLYYGHANPTTLARQHPILQMPYSFSPAKRRRPTTYVTHKKPKLPVYSNKNHNRKQNHSYYFGYYYDPYRAYPMSFGSYYY